MRMRYTGRLLWLVLLLAGRQALAGTSTSAPEEGGDIDLPIPGLTPSFRGADHAALESLEVSTPIAESISLTPSGDYFARFERRTNYGSATGTSTDFIRTRAELGLRTSRLRVSPQHAIQVRFMPYIGGYWQTGGDALEDPILMVNQAALSIFGSASRLEVGRFQMSYGDELVIGTESWSHTPRAFDGARLHVQHHDSGAWTDLFVVQLSEGVLEAPPSNDPMAGDQYFLGAYSSAGPLLLPGNELDFYALELLTPGFFDTEGNGYNTGSLLTLGSRIKGGRGLLEYRAETGLQVELVHLTTGQKEVLGFQLDGEIGFLVPVLRGARIGLEGFLASGSNPDDPGFLADWNQLFPTVHRYLGQMDYFQARTNVAGGAAHLALEPAARWQLNLDAHGFFRPRPSGDLGPYAGFEIDSGVEFLLGKDLTLRSAYDVFVPARDRGDELMRFVELEIRAKF